MVKTELIEVTIKKDWENFLSSREEANFLQSWNWGEFHLKLGRTIHRVGFYVDSKLVGVLLTIVEDAKRGRYLTVPGGPIIDWDDQGIVNAFLDEIKKIAREEKCVFVRVRPQLLLAKESENLFKKLGFRHAPMHLHAELTNQLDVQKGENEILAGMRKSTRYEVRQAASSGVKVTSSTNPEEIEAFYQLQLDTATRQKFVPFSYKFLYEQFKVFSVDNQVLLYKAMKGKTLLADAFVIFYGKEAVYHYGASTQEGREFPGAYLIQWEAIKEAKRRGMKRYNFWGVAPEGAQGHRFAGLSIFKRGFGGEDVYYLPAHDLVIDKFRYLINYTIETMRRRIRNV